jgi:tRNA nucleotidyltransferase/poly(A) polymerase
MSGMTHRIPPDAKQLLDALVDIFGTDGGVVLVGGSVRDSLLGTPPKDYDLATRLQPDEVERRLRLAGKRVYTVGKRYGTLGFRHDSQFVEITTYRSDKYQASSRKPDVAFTDDLRQDLARRDFTINAMALTADEQLIDPFGGAADLQAGILRAVGQPAERFQEDPLRLLRLVRFLAQYGFDIEPATDQAARQQAHQLLRISTERIAAELDGIMIAPHVKAAWQYLADSGMLSFSVPLLAAQLGCNDHLASQKQQLWDSSLQTMANAKSDVVERWAALLQNVAGPFVYPQTAPLVSHTVCGDLGAVLVAMVGRHLKWSNERTKQVSHLVQTANH